MADDQQLAEALASLRKLRDEVRARNLDITTDEQALAVADEITRAAIDRLVEKGQIRFAGETQASAERSKSDARP